MQNFRPGDLVRVSDDEQTIMELQKEYPSIRKIFGQEGIVRCVSSEHVAVEVGECIHSLNPKWLKLLWEMDEVDVSLFR